MALWIYELFHKAMDIRIWAVDIRLIPHII